MKTPPNYLYVVIWHIPFPIHFNFERKSLIHTLLLLENAKDKEETQIFEFHYLSCLPNNSLETFLANNKFSGT